MPGPPSSATQGRSSLLTTCSPWRASPGWDQEAIYVRHVTHSTDGLTECNRLVPDGAVYRAT